MWYTSWDYKLAQILEAAPAPQLTTRLNFQPFCEPAFLASHHDVTDKRYRPVAVVGRRKTSRLPKRLEIEPTPHPLINFFLLGLLTQEQTLFSLKQYITILLSHRQAASQAKQIITHTKMKDFARCFTTIENISCWCC